MNRYKDYYGMLKVNEIFISLDGEVNCQPQGGFATFIRLQGCNLSCSYCDTIGAQNAMGGDWMSVGNIMEEISDGPKKITLTGGEPLVQDPDAFFDLTKRLHMKGYTVSVETNGSMAPFAWNVDCWVMDWKLTSSGMADCMRPSNFVPLRHKDIVKFIIGTEADFAEAVKRKETLMELGCNAKFAFSPRWHVMSAKRLYDLMVEHVQYDSILNVQLHKMLKIK